MACLDDDANGQRQETQLQPVVFRDPLEVNADRVHLEHPLVQRQRLLNRFLMRASMAIRSVGWRASPACRWLMRSRPKRCERVTSTASGFPTRSSGPRPAVAISSWPLAR